MTAVPLRIGRGPQAVEVLFREDRARQVGLEELAAFATKDPQNRLGVRSIEVTLPRAPEGLRFLDTPGVGSLTSSGSAEAFAWLPRCDLGLVLVAAGTPLGRDETSLVSGLRHAGIDCCVLLSKADLLDEADTREALAYIRARLGPVVPPTDRIDVRAVSTRPAFASGLERLQSELLRPLAREHGKRAAEALRTRLHRLIAVIAAALDGGPSPPAGDAVEFEKRRGAALEVIDRTTETLAVSAARLLEDSARVVAAAWARGEDAAVSARSAIVGTASQSLAAVREVVDALRAHGAVEAGDDSRRLPPLYDPEFLDAIRSLPPPRIAPTFLRRGMAWRALAPLLTFLDDSLHHYAERLRTWGAGALKETRPRADAGAGTPIRHAELAALESLIAEIHETADLSPAPEGAPADAA